MCETRDKLEARDDGSIHRARELLLRHGWNATCYQLINPGFHLWFSRRVDALVGYVQRAGVCVVAGAPVCAWEHLPDVVRQFEAVAASHRLGVCYFGAEARLEAFARATGTHALVLLGAQPSWRPDSWEAILRHRSSLRAQLRRARNKGVSVEEWAPARATRHPALERCLREWLASRRLPPLHFLIEPDTLERLFDRRVFVADRAGSVLAFLVASPVPTRNGWLIEQIVRGSESPNGTSELLIDAAFRAFAADGASYVTMGLSPLSTRVRSADDDAPAWMRLFLKWVRRHGARFYNFQGLDSFKAKFEPERWEPIYAISNRTPFGPRTLYAVVAAFAGESPLRFLIRVTRKALRTHLVAEPRD